MVVRTAVDLLNHRECKGSDELRFLVIWASIRDAWVTGLNHVQAWSFFRLRFCDCSKLQHTFENHFITFISKVPGSFFEAWGDWVTYHINLVPRSYLTVTENYLQSLGRGKSGYETIILSFPLGRKKMSDVFFLFFFFRTFLTHLTRLEEKENFSRHNHMLKNGFRTDWGFQYCQKLLLL